MSASWVLTRVGDEQKGRDERIGLGADKETCVHDMKQPEPQRRGKNET